MKKKYILKNRKIIKHAKTIGTDIILVYIKGVNYRYIDEEIKEDVPNVNYKEDTYNFSVKIITL